MRNGSKSLPEPGSVPGLSEVEPQEAALEDRGSTRRAFLQKAGLGAAGLALAGQTCACLRALVPNLLYEEPARFKVGPPAQYEEGVTFLEDRRLFIFREGTRYHAVSAVCTHLGCTVKLARLSQPQQVKALGRELTETLEFHCPCHGSKYYADGTNYAGPAPQPLAHFKLEVSPDDGQLIVDLSQRVDRDFRVTV